MKNLITVLLVSLFMSQVEGFRTLMQAQAYATQKPEFPESDNDDFERPDYHTFYQQDSGWWQKFLARLGLRRQLWNPNDTVAQLTKVSDSLKDKTLHPELSLPAGSTMIIIGNLYGAFHSLVRDLTHLVEQNILDTSFRIQKANTYLVCLGDAINYSAYSLETLSLLLALLEANPDTMFYVKSAHESKMMWHQYGLMQEIKNHFGTKKDQAIDLIDIFFSRLPHDLTVILKSSGEKFFLGDSIPEDKDFKVRVTRGSLQNYGQGQGLYRERTAQHLIWSVVSSPVKLYRNRYNFFYDAYAVIELQSTLATSTISLFYGEGDGAFKKGPKRNFLTGVRIERGIWPPATTQAPPISLDAAALTRHIDTLKAHFDILNEQFMLIKSQVRPDLLPSPSTDRHTDIITKLKTNASFSLNELNEAANDTEQNYNALAVEMDDLALVAGQKELKTEIVSKKKPALIRLGTSMDLTKSVRGLGIPFREGIALKVNKQNQEGGINDKLVQIVFLDDGYRPSISRQNILKLLHEYGTPYIISPIGTPTLLASLDLIQKKEILVLFPQSGSPIFRKPDLTHIINFRASFEDEGRLLTDYVIKTFLLKNFVFFYQDDAFGLSILKGAKEALEQAKITKVTEVSYLANTTLFKDAAEKIRITNPDAIAFFATGPATLQLIRDIGVEFLANKILFAVSSVGDEATLKVLKDKGLNVILGQLVPHPHTSTLEIVEEYRKEIAQAGALENVFSLEAYIVTSIAFDQISKIKGELTMQKLLDQMQSIRNYKYKGLTLNFNPETRSLAKYMWIDTGKGDWIQKEIARK